MDGERFDQLARTLATSTNRRRLLGGLLGGTLAGLGLGSAAAQGACPRDEPIRCGNDCVDLRTNPEHCGRCGRACAVGDVCYAGRCMANCPNGFAACNGTCVRACSSNLQPDPASDCACGCPSELPTQCGTSCLPDGACCTNAECDDEIACTVDQCQNGSCVSTPNAALCADGNVCTANTCDSVSGCQSTPLSDTPCGIDRVCCNGECCIEGQTCTDGVCTLPLACAESCSGCCNGETCITATSDTACGAEGGACLDCTQSGTGWTCDSSGVCQPPPTCAESCSGCCDGETCRTASDATCGINGDACVDCNQEGAFGQVCSSGTYETPPETSFTVDGELVREDPDYVRCIDGPASSNIYKTHPFTHNGGRLRLYLGGWCAGLMAGHMDLFLALYSTFDPSNPCVNLIASDDNGANCGNDAYLDLPSLSAGSYVAVITTPASFIDDADLGSWTLRAGQTFACSC